MRYRLKNFQRKKSMKSKSEIDDLRMLRDDVLLEEIDYNKFVSRTIVTLESKHEHDLRFYKVLASGPDTKEIKAGDTVVAPWSRTTLEFLFESRRLRTTSEKEVWLILSA